MDIQRLTCSDQRSIEGLVLQRQEGIKMRPGSRGYIGGGLQPPGTGMRMATGGALLPFEKLVAPLSLVSHRTGGASCGILRENGLTPA